MRLQINSAQKIAFREIFSLVAKDGKIDKDGFEEIFKLIDYKLTEKQLAEFHSKLFKQKDTITFDDFLKIFNLKMADYTSIDVKNAFKLLAKDDDKYISLESIKEILKKNNMSEMDVHFITTQLLAFTENGKVNYDQFLKNLSI